MKKIWMEIGKNLLGKMGFEVKEEEGYSVPRYLLTKRGRQAKVLFEVLHNDTLWVRIEHFYKFESKSYIGKRRTNKMYFLLKEWFVGVAEHEKMKTIVISGYFSTDNFNVPFKEVKRDFNDREKLLNLLSGDYYLNVEESYIERKERTRKILIDSIHELTDETTKVVKYEYEMIQLYHKGCLADLETVNKDDSYYVQFNGKAYEVNHDGIQLLLKRMEEFARIKNILKPPCFHLEDYLIRRMISKEAVEIVQYHLLKKYSFEEIELYCAELENSEKRMEVKWKTDYGVFALMDTYFVYMREENEIKAYETKRELETKGREFIMEHIRKKTGKELHDIIQQI